MEATIRIYVGGLGETVTDEEIRNTFSKLGAVEAVDIVRTKGRSFAYVNFIPLSDKSLAKLFSTYNGCSWKGGKLRLEKARQHYLDKLKAEWAEETELANKKQDDNQKEEDKEKTSCISQVGHKRDLDVKDEQIRMFIPKFRKVKSLPYRGTGKHKYSFQRIDVPALPNHFCDCVEHSRDLESVKPRQFNHIVIENGGMKEDEINIMNSVMNKLFNSENNSKSSLRPSVSSVASENPLLKEDGEDYTTDDDGGDNIVINTRHRQDDETILLKSLKRLQKGSSQVDVTAFGHLPHNQAGEDDSTDDDNIMINMGSNHDDERLLLESMKQQQTRSAKKVKRSAKAHDSSYEHDPMAIKDKPSRKKTKPAKLGASKKASAAFTPNRENEMQIQPSTAEKEPLSSILREEFTVKLSASKNKSKWKRLVDPKDNSSFTLSSLIPVDQSSKDLEHPKPDASGVPSDDGHDSKLGDHVTNNLGLDPLSSELKQSGDGVVSSDKPDDGHDPQPRPHVTNNASSDPMSSESKQSGGDVSTEKPDGGHNPELGDHVTNNMTSDSLSSESKQSGPVVSLEKPGRGVSWAQKSSWAQLVGGGNKNSAFSISQILTGTNSQKKTLRTPCSQPNASLDNLIKQSGPVERPRNSDSNSGKQVDMNVLQKDKDTYSSKEKDQVRGWWKNARESNLESISASSMEIDKVDLSLPEKRDSSLEKRSDKGTPRPTVTISETCPFMRSASSMQDWKTTKEALNRSLKKKKKEETS